MYAFSIAPSLKMSPWNLDDFAEPQPPFLLDAFPFFVSPPLPMLPVESLLLRFFLPLPAMMVDDILTTTKPNVSEKNICGESFYLLIYVCCLIDLTRWCLVTV